MRENTTRSQAGVPESVDDDELSSASARARTVVVVGNGMVSHHLCQRLVEQGAGNCPRIVVLGEETRPAYDRVRLGEMLKGRRATSLKLATADWYFQNGIDLVLGDPVVTVDRDAKIVRTKSGREVSYDSLVFATGASPVMPPMEVEEKTDIFVIRTTGHVETLRARATTARKAAVVGGGLLGLEAARSLLDAGLEVSVIEAGPQLMARQLDEEASTVLKNKLERSGLKVILGEKVQRIAAAGQGRARLVFQAGSSRPALEVDLVVISIGVRPRDELATACGLSCGRDGGIAVDKLLRTSDRRIFAMGDCAAVDNVTFGLIAPGYRMAEALAGTLLGHPTEFDMPVAPVRLKVAGVEVVTMGETRRRARHRTYRFRHNSVYRRVVIEDGRVVGATSVGNWPELGAVQESISDRRHLDLGWRERFNREGTLWRGVAAPAISRREDKVCMCANVTAGTIQDAIAAGCTTVDAIATATGATRGCGSCLPLVSLMVGQPAAPDRKPRAWMAGFAALALAGTALMLALPPAPLADALASFGVDRLFREPFWQQVSGFTLLGMCALAMLLPLAKRALHVGGTSLPAWRAAHTGIGVGALLAMVVHTNLRTGHHMNFVLEAAFAALLLLGGAAGLLGLDRGGRLGRLLRLGHLFVFWPLLGLIGLHVLAVYYF
ncbi:MAG TPA: FAD-dependent oxidoreductase [Polyangia bacterium]|nr:FAD-dependent oxidoreductase [Polyangia bacterium]